MNSIYLLLIAVLALFSWVGSVFGIMLPDDTPIPCMLSEESIRWFVRHSMDNLSAAPFAEVSLVLLAAGSIRSSGLWHALRHQSQLSQRQRHALFTALTVMGACTVLILLGIRPGGNLLSVTGHLSGGPFATGWCLLLTMEVLIPCIVYGKMCGRWNTSDRLYAGISSAIASCSSYFITLIIASQLVASIRYIRLFHLAGLSSTIQDFCISLIYAIPLITLFVTNKKPHDTSSTE